jgi:hypothetical protein
MNGFKMGLMEVAGNMFPPIIGLKLPVVARVPNQKRPREWRVGLKILGGRLVVDGRSEAMMANWLQMMLNRKNNEHTELGCTFLFLFLFWGDRNLEQDSFSY